VSATPRYLLAAQGPEEGLDWKRGWRCSDLLLQIPVPRLHGSLQRFCLQVDHDTFSAF